jgi:hypothetical protein
MLPSFIAQKFITLVSHGFFDQASSLFHYPNSYTIEKRKNEFDSVRNDLQKCAEIFGSIVEISSALPNGSFIGFGISGAETDYWSDFKGETIQVTLPARFKNAGWGILKIGLISHDNRWEIQQVDYSLVKTEGAIKAIRILTRTI